MRDRTALMLPAIRILSFALLMAGAALGVIEIVIAALAQAQGMASAAGVLLALLSVGSMVGGLMYGRCSWARSAAHSFVWVCWLLAAGCGLLFVSEMSQSIIQVGLSTMIVGLAVSPLLICAYMLADVHATPQGRAEATTWMSTAHNGGAALGSARAGLVVGQAGASTALVACAGCTVIGALVATGFRSRLLTR